jgi:UDP-N-acetylmuramoylalanine--D-glutamate ligase
VPVADLFNADLEILVVELSSFQLHFWQPSPVAAALANIAPDHLDWHGTFDRYVAAKAKVGAGLGVNGVLAYNADDATAVAVVGASMARGVPCSGIRVPPDGNGVAGDDLVIGGSRIPHGIPDPSYRLDLVLAATIASVAGATDDAIASVVGAFAPGEHRRRVVGVVDGVAWIDDSKATNPHAAVAAAASYPSVRLLAGGRNKALDLSPIGSVSSVRHLYAFGEAGPDIAATASVPVTVHVSMLDAMAAARTDAVSGDVVLLSPGCTSFDEFTSYAERGTVFAETVLSMVGGDMR